MGHCLVSCEPLLRSILQKSRYLQARDARHLSVLLRIHLYATMHGNMHRTGARISVLDARPDVVKPRHLLCTYQVDSIWWHALAEDLGPWVSFDLREFELRVVGVHGMDFIFCWSSQNLDNLHQLVYAALACSREDITDLTTNK